MSETDWKVLPHDPMRQVADRVWVVDGDLEGIALRRRMVVVKLDDGLLIHNAVAMDDAGMAALEALGTPRYLIVPSGYHRMDGPRFKARYPDIAVLCPAGARGRVEKVVAVDATYDSLPEGLAAAEGVEIVHVEGCKQREGAVLVDGATLILNDLLFNVPHGKGAFWFVYGRMMGNAGGPKVTSIARWFILKDKKAYRAQLEGWADGGVERVIMAHGDIIEDDAPGVLRQVAATL